MTWMRSNSLARPACFLEWRGDCRYLFDCDVLGYNTGHVPRHSRKHADLAAEHSRIQDIRIDAFRSSVNEVRSGAWPAPEHTVNAPQAEMDAFKKLLTK